MAGEVETGVILKAIDQFSQTTEKFQKALDEIQKKSNAAGKGLGDAGKIADQFGLSMGSIESQVMGLLPMFSVAAIGKFFVDAVMDADKFNEAMGRLGDAVKNTGGDWEANKAQVADWADTLQKTTKFSDDQTVPALQRTVTAIGNLAQAQDLVKLAMDVSTKTGKDFDTVLQDLTMTWEGQERGMKAVEKQFGGIVKGAKDNTEMLNLMRKSYDEGAESSKSLGTQVSKITNGFGDFGKEIGQQLLPAVNGLIVGFKYLVDGIMIVWKTAEFIATELVNIFVNLNLAILKAMTFNFKGASASMKDFMGTMKEDAKKFADDIVKITDTGEKAKQAAIKKTTEFAGKETEKDKDARKKSVAEAFKENESLTAKLKKLHEEQYANAQKTNGDILVSDKSLTDDIVAQHEAMKSTIIGDIAGMFTQYATMCASFTDIWKSFTDDLQSYFETKLINYLAEQFLTGILGGLLDIVMPGTGSLVSSIFGSKASGGYISQTGNYQLHQGEYVVPNQNKAFTPVTSPQAKGSTNNNMNASITINSSSGNAQDIARAVGLELQRQVRGMGQTGMVPA